MTTAQNILIFLQILIALITLAKITAEFIKAIKTRKEIYNYA